MKRLIAFIVVLAAVIGISAPTPAHGQDVQGLIGDQLEWDFSIDIGQMFFREDRAVSDYLAALPELVTKIHEDFDSFYTRANFRAGNYDYDQVEAGLNFNLFGTEDQTDVLSIHEMWFDPSGWPLFETRTRQYVTMDVHGLEILPEIGYGCEIVDGIRVAALFGYGYRRTELERTPGIPDTDYDVHYLNFKGRVRVDCPNVDGLTFLVEPMIGPVIASKRTDDIQGDDFTIRGTGGVMFSIRGQAKYAVTDNIRMLAGVFYDFQYLDGGSHIDEDGFGGVGAKQDLTKYEWDDHFMQAVGGTLGVEFLF